jgi:hypothetical protein
MHVSRPVIVLRVFYLLWHLLRFVLLLLIIVVPLISRYLTHLLTLLINRSALATFAFRITAEAGGRVLIVVVENLVKEAARAELFGCMGSRLIPGLVQMVHILIAIHRHMAFETCSHFLLVVLLLLLLCLLLLFHLVILLIDAHQLFSLLSFCISTTLGAV